MTDTVLRQTLRDLQLAQPGDLEALSAWLFAELRAGAAGLPRSGQRAPFVLQIRKAPDKVRRKEMKSYGPGKPKIELLCRELLCHPWPTSVRQTNRATSSYWAISMGGRLDEESRGWCGFPGELYISPTLERGAYRFAVWYREHHSIHFKSPEELLEYLGPQWRRGWNGQPRLVSWTFADSGAQPCQH